MRTFDQRVSFGKHGRVHLAIGPEGRAEGVAGHQGFLLEGLDAGRALADDGRAGKHERLLDEWIEMVWGNSLSGGQGGYRIPQRRSLGLGFVAGDQENHGGDDQ